MFILNQNVRNQIERFCWGVRLAARKPCLWRGGLGGGWGRGGGRIAAAAQSADQGDPAWYDGQPAGINPIGCFVPGAGVLALNKLGIEREEDGKKAAGAWTGGGRSLYFLFSSLPSLTFSSSLLSSSSLIERSLSDPGAALLPGGRRHLPCLPLLHPEDDQGVRESRHLSPGTLSGPGQVAFLDFILDCILPSSVRGPGLYFVLPCLDRCSVVDLRTRTHSVPRQEVCVHSSSLLLSQSINVHSLVWSPSIYY